MRFGGNQIRLVYEVQAHVYDFDDAACNIGFVTVRCKQHLYVPRNQLENCFEQVDYRSCKTHAIVSGSLSHISEQKFPEKAIEVKHIPEFSLNERLMSI